MINITENDFDQIDAAFKEAKTVKRVPDSDHCQDDQKEKDVSFMENQAGCTEKAPNMKGYAVAMADFGESR